MTLDLGDLKSVAAFVTAFKKRKLPLNLLINNVWAVLSVFFLALSLIWRSGPRRLASWRARLRRRSTALSHRCVCICQA